MISVKNVGCIGYKSDKPENRPPPERRTRAAAVPRYHSHQAQCNAIAQTKFCPHLTLCASDRQNQARTGQKSSAQEKARPHPSQRESRFAEQPKLRPQRYYPKNNSNHPADSVVPACSFQDYPIMSILYIRFDAAPLR